MDIAGSMAQGARDDGFNPLDLTFRLGQGEFSGWANVFDGAFSGQGIQ